MPTPPIDREKLRTYVRKLDGEDHLILLDRAIDLLPKSKLPKLIRDYARLADLRPDGSSPTELLDAVRGFHTASLRGEYYEYFMVDSRNFMQKSEGTQCWIAECHRLLDLCEQASKTDSYAETRTAFELIFDLLLQIDECRDDIIFFADEAGSWQVGVNWRAVLPAWFRCLAATASADEYATQVRATISYFAHYEVKVLMPKARRSGNKEQRAALSRLPPPEKTYEQPSFTP